MPIQELSLEQVSGIASQYPNLRSLNLSNNDIPVLQHLEMLPDIEKLDLNGNQLSSISGIGSLQKLKEFRCARNRIDACGLASDTIIPSLSILDISENSVDTYEVFDSILACFPALTSLAVAGNPIAKDRGAKFHAIVSQRCPELQLLDGKAYNHGIGKQARILGELERLRTRCKQLEDQLQQSEASSAANHADLQKAIVKASAAETRAEECQTLLRTKDKELEASTTSERNAMEKCALAQEQLEQARAEVKALRSYIGNVPANDKAAALQQSVLQKKDVTPEQFGRLQSQVSALREVLKLQDGLALSADGDAKKLVHGWRGRVLALLVQRAADNHHRTSSKQGNDSKIRDLSYC